MGPKSVSGTGQGWSVDPATGQLGLILPFANVRGDIPIPVVARFLGTHVVEQRWIFDPNWDPNDPDAPPHPNHVWAELDRPIYASLHLGYITNGGAVYDGVQMDASYVLEDGRSFQDWEWTDWSAVPNAGPAFSLPPQFGLAARSTDSVRLNSQATHVLYDATQADLGSLSVPIPEGYGVAPTAFKILMDKDRARVFAYLDALNAWVPLLWLDRFGHKVNFQWKQFTSGLPSGYTSVHTVKVLNDNNKGVQLQWPETFNGPGGIPNDTELDVLRVDFIGIQAPSIGVKGYLGVSGNRPSGLSGLRTEYSQPVYPEVAGAVFRPTHITVDQPAYLGHPVWSMLSQPAMPGGNVWAAGLTWSFVYDSSKAGITGFTDALNVSTTFGSQNHVLYDGNAYNSNRYLGITQSTSADGQTGTSLYRTWNRVLPVYGTGSWTQSNWSCTTAQTFAPGSSTGSSQNEYTYAGPNQTQSYANGALVRTRVLSSGGVELARSDNTLTTYGADGSLTTVSGQQTTVSGGLSTFQSSSPNALTGAPTTVITRLGSFSGTMLEQTVYTYDPKPALLDAARLTATETTRYRGGAALPAVRSVIEYNAQGLPSKSYLDAGGTLQKGQSYDYSAGRLTGLSSHAPFTNRGAVSKSFSLNSSTGLPQSAVTTYDNPTGQGGTTISESWGNYDSADRPGSTTDALGITTSTTYDTRGRATQVTRPAQPSVSVTYSGERQRTVTQLGQSTIETVDGFGRLKSRARPDGVTETYTYDSSGRVVSVLEVNQVGTGRSRSTTYDGLGRPVTQTPVSGPSASFTYSASGEWALTSVTYSSGFSAQTYQDLWGQTVKQTDPNGNTTEATFDGLGNPTRIVVTPASGPVQERTFHYTALGFLDQRTEPETGTTTFGVFNAQGQPGTMTEGGSRYRTLVYDGLGRLRSMTNGADSVAYVYNGPLLSSSSSVTPDGTVSQAFTYDGPGSGGSRLRTESTTQTGYSAQTITYGYDGYSRLTSLTYPSGRTVGYGYDGRNRLGTITHNGASFATVSYDDWNNRQNVTFASGAKSEWIADSMGQHLSTWRVTPNGGPVETRSYTYDANDFLSTLTPDWTTLQHDAQGQLKRADGYGMTSTLDYDGYGNNKSWAPVGNVPASLNPFAIGDRSDNRMPSQTLSGQVTGWIHGGPAGEATQIGQKANPSNSQLLGLTWDGLGRLLRSTLNGATQTYLYNAGGMRVSYTDSLDSVQNRRYAYTSGGLLLGEYGPGGAGRLSAKAARVYHHAGTASDVSRTLGTFSAGETVTVSTWFKAPVGTTGSMYLTDNASYSATDAKKFIALQGNGGWQQLSFSQNLTQSATLSLHLYGDMYTATSGTVPEGSFVTYDDVVVSSTSQPSVLNDGFEAGIGAWATCAGNLDLASPGTAADTWKRDVIYLGSEAIAEVDASGIHELHNDHLGTPRVITMASTGAKEGQQAFSPYGEQLSWGTNQPNWGYQPLTGYTGHLQQDPTQLIYMRGRYYSPAWHRFVNSDQGIDPLSMNQHAYAAGSPLQNTDPTGLLIVADDPGGTGPTVWGEWTSVDYAFYDGSWGASWLGGLGTMTGTGFGNRTGSTGGAGTGPQAPTPAKPAPKDRTCVGEAYILAGNTDLIGEPGGFSGNSPIFVTSGSAAIIPSQWGGSKRKLRPYLSDISGRLSDGTSLFNSVTDVVGHAELGTASQAQRIIMKRAPGRVVIEVPGGKHLGIQKVEN
jgi:RHS repeat-associated protein